MTATESSRTFVAPSGFVSGTMMTWHHGFWNDLWGFDHPIAVLLPASQYNGPINDGWVAEFESTLVKLPRVQAVFIDRDDFSQALQSDLKAKFPFVEFIRHAQVIEASE